MMDKLNILLSIPALPECKVNIHIINTFTQFSTIRFIFTCVYCIVHIVTVLFRMLINK